MAVELGILETAGAGIIEDSEIAFVDVFADPGTPAFHLFIKDGAAQGADKDDILYIRRIVTGGEEINSYRDARLAGSHQGKVTFQLMAIALRPGDAGSIFVVTREAPQLLGHECRVRVVNTENDAFLIAQVVLSQDFPQVFGDGSSTIRHTDLTLEISGRIGLAVRAYVAVLVEVRDSFFQEVRNEKAVFNSLFEAVGVDRVPEILECVAPNFLFCKRRGYLLPARVAWL